jgi:hypothetical protein
VHKKTILVLFISFFSTHAMERNVTQDENQPCKERSKRTASEIANVKIANIAAEEAEEDEELTIPDETNEKNQKKQKIANVRAAHMMSEKSNLYFLIIEFEKDATKYHFIPLETSRKKSAPNPASSFLPNISQMISENYCVTIFEHLNQEREYQFIKKKDLITLNYSDRKS